MSENARKPRIRFKGFSDAWEQRKLSDIADRFDNLRIPVAANLRVHGSTPYYGANGIQDYVSGFTHDGEFVLVAEDGANDLKNGPADKILDREKGRDLCTQGSKRERHLQCMMQRNQSQRSSGDWDIRRNRHCTHG